MLIGSLTKPSQKEDNRSMVLISVDMLLELSGVVGEALVKTNTRPGCVVTPLIVQGNIAKDVKVSAYKL